MSKKRRENQAKQDKKVAANELLAEPKGKDLKGYRKATTEEELKLTKSLANLGILHEKAGRLKNEIQVHKANAQNAETEHRETLVVAVQAQQAHKKIIAELGLDPADAENLKDHDGVMYVRVAKGPDKKPKDVPPPPVPLEPGKPVEIAPGIEATLNKK